MFDDERWHVGRMLLVPCVNEADRIQQREKQEKYLEGSGLLTS